MRCCKTEQQGRARLDNNTPASNQIMNQLDIMLRSGMRVT